MRDNLLFSDAQSRTNPTSGGTISDFYFDLEKNSAAATLITDDQLVCSINVVLTAVTFTSGGESGIILEVRTDDNVNHSTAQVVIGAIEIPLTDIVAGAKFSIPVIKNVMKRYVAGWLRAKSETYTGIIVVEQYVDFAPIGPNESIQKVPA